MKNPPLELYNTETREKQQVTPQDGKTVRMYTCGPTVYNFAHIGNFRTYVFEDLLRRTIKFFGFDLKQVMNLTDIDDKTIKGALQNKVSLDAFTQPFKDAFFEDLSTLGIERVEYYPQATDYIPEMVSMIQVLFDKGVAYKGQDESIYFSIRKFPSYGRLSHLDLDSLKEGASERVFLDEYEKEDVSDFVLWKAYDPERDGAVYWDSPFGKGRPGWHIECSAMAMKLLGESIDIHVGGVDNMFPHHENEIAQSETYSDKRFVAHWLHCEHLLVNHKKMSKSLGNFYTLRDLLDKGYSGREVRYLLLQTHYCTQQNFTLEGIDAARASLQRMRDFIVRLKSICAEKMKGALDVILDRALPEGTPKKQVSERIFFELKSGMSRDIFSAEEMKPLIERGLKSVDKSSNLASEIARKMTREHQKEILTPLLRKAFAETPSGEGLVTKVLQQILSDQRADILDPHAMRSVLERSLQGTQVHPEAVSNLLLDLKQKKNQGFVLPLLVKTMQSFKESLADDLNISVALASLFELLREVNTLCDQGKIGICEAEDVLDFLAQVDLVLHILPLEEEQQAPAHLEEALRQREEARRIKDWKKADSYRDLILAAGYSIEDTPQGSRLKRGSL